VPVYPVPLDKHMHLSYLLLLEGNVVSEIDVCTACCMAQTEGSSLYDLLARL
jgi:hypothetical protein